MPGPLHEKRVEQWAKYFEDLLNPPQHRQPIRDRWIHAPGSVPLPLRVERRFATLFNEEFTVAHACSACGDRELFSIPMKRVASVVCDKAVFPSFGFRPDVALLDREGNPLVVFEIVDTHHSTEEKQQFYRDSGVPVFEIGAALQYEQYITPTEADIDSLGEPDASMYRAVRAFYQDPEGSGRASSYEPARRLPDGRTMPSTLFTSDNFTHHLGGDLDDVARLPDGQIGPYPHARSAFNVPCERDATNSYDPSMFMGPRRENLKPKGVDARPLNPEAALYEAGFGVFHTLDEDKPIWQVGYDRRSLGAWLRWPGQGARFMVPPWYTTHGHYRSLDHLDSMMWDVAGIALDGDIEDLTVDRIYTNTFAIRKFRCPIPAEACCGGIDWRFRYPGMNEEALT